MSRVDFGAKPWAFPMPVEVVRILKELLLLFEKRKER